MQALALDFDGVIADSRRETFEVALATYREMRPTVDFDRIAPEILYARFSALLPFGNRAEDFGVALAAIDGEISENCSPRILDQETYWAFARQRDATWLTEFHSRFYLNRRKLREENLQAWLAWTPPYSRFVALLPKLAQQWRLAIATAKDRDSVELLLCEYGIAELFDPQLIFDKETGVNKSAHFQALRARLQIPFEKITFIDDKVNHLDVAAKLRLSCVLAAWGYNTLQEHELARARGYSVLELDQVEALLLEPNFACTARSDGASKVQTS